jgi:anti-sigma regulatory factor (Ser/Thr protein kinase)
MNWHLHIPDRRAASQIRAEVGAFLRRHGTAESDFAGAELVASELISNAVRHAPGPAWVHVDWTDREPVLEVHDLGPGFELRTELPADPSAPSGRGLAIAAIIALELTVVAKAAGGSKVSARLPVHRAQEESFDPPLSRTASLPAEDEARAAGFSGGRVVVWLSGARRADFAAGHDYGSTSDAV